MKKYPTGYNIFTLKKKSRLNILQEIAQTVVVAILLFFECFGSQNKKRKIYQTLYVSFDTIMGC